MWKKALFTIAAFVLFFLLSAAAHADGIIIPVPPPDIPPERVVNLAIRYHHVTVTIENQIATTEIDQVFVNESPYEIEGLYVFPLPEGSAISDFTLFVDGVEVMGRILEKEEARRIYEDTVRKQRDPALLEYVGRHTFRARIFPIPPKGEKRVTLRYSELLHSEAQLVRYTYPLNTERFSSKPLEEVSIHVDIHTKDPLRALYSPSHEVAFVRDGEHHAEIGYEAYNIKPDRDFELYYSVASQDLGLSLLSFKEADEDGFFLLLAAPKFQVTGQDTVAKDVIVVLDVSGSMRGAKLKQAKDALNYILNHLKEEDRFNIIAFSTGTKRFARELQDVVARDEAYRFVRDLEAAGGTNINRALLEALDMASGTPTSERPQIVIFLTDGLATEGIVETDKIIANVAEAALKTVRIFAFGIGDDVNTTLLDTIAQEHRGASAYVRPSQSIAEEVSAFYAKVSTPLLTDLEIDFGEIMVEDVYPYPLPDLFAGSQLVVVGRYRRGGEATLKIRGRVNDQEQVFTYKDIRFRTDDGESFIPVIWATRKIGYLLTQIRLHGENKELVDEIVELSVRYGIMTPYTAFLVDENEDVLTAQGRGQTVEKYQAEVAKQATVVSGAPAVERSVGHRALQDSAVVQAPISNQVAQVRNHAFILRDGVWADTRYDPQQMQPRKIRFGSDAYFALLNTHSEAGKYLSLGRNMIIILDGQAYEIAEGEGLETAVPTATATKQPPSKRTETLPSLTPTKTSTPTPEPTLTPRPNLWQRIWRWLSGLF